MAKQLGRLAVLPVLTVALTLSGVGIAHAEDAPAPSAFPTDRPSQPPHRDHGSDDGDDDHHQEIHDKYGNDVDQVFLPPLTVTGSGGLNPAGKAPINGSAPKPGQPGDLKNANQIDPGANQPINPNTHEVNGKTPADRFFEAATFGLALMGLGAVGLGGAVVVQRRRHRSENQ
jgi:hypothetical protein